MKTKTAPIPYPIEDNNDDEEEAFLREVAAAEAEAASSTAKRPKLTAAETETKPEGAYIAALKGSKSPLWQQQQQQRNVLDQRSSASHAASAVVSGHQSESGGGSGEDVVPEKKCPCGLGDCLILTSNTQRNPGRRFYKCPLREENGGCGFFEWCDSNRSSGADTGCYSYGNVNESTVPDLQCPCGAGSCRVLTARTGQNVGQQFYRCPNQTSCGFFKWCNDQTPVVTSATPHSFNSTNNFNNLNDSEKDYSGPKTGSSCFKCGKEGHWTRDCTASSEYSLPESGGGGGRPSSLSSASGTCFKCGKGGHWARDCSTSSDYPQPVSGGRSSLPSSAASGTCFKCGKEGHWAKDCSASSSYSQPESGGGRSLSTSSSSAAGTCFKCGEAGHWARDCSSGQHAKAPAKRHRL